MRLVIRIPLLIWYCLLVRCDAYKILVYNPRFGASHVSFTGKIADILAGAGHDIVVYQPILERAVTNNGSSNPTIRFIISQYDPNKPGMHEDQGGLWADNSLLKEIRIFRRMADVKKKYCEFVMNDKKSLELLRKEHFDLAIGEMFEACGFVVFEILGINKYIVTHSSSLITSLGLYSGVPQAPSILPSLFTDYTDKMNFFQRVNNFLMGLFERYIMDNMIWRGPQEAIKEIIPGFDIKKKAADSIFLFTNSDEYVDYITPTTPKIIYIGGFGKVESKPLEKKYSAIFDKAKKGVIYLSFGTVVLSKDMPVNLKKTFLEAFSEFPEINFIWKYEKEEENIAENYKNVFTFPYLPQNDILDHPKLLAFITHGGMNSITETAAKGVPVICIPIFGDQNHNAKILEARGTGIVIPKNEITKEFLVSAIRKIVENKSYSENARRLARVVKAKPMNAEERIIKYTEFAAEFSDSINLHSEGRNLHWIQLYFIDVVLFLSSTVFLIIFLVYKLGIRITQKVKNIFLSVDSSKKHD